MMRERMHNNAYLEGSRKPPFIDKRGGHFQNTKTLGGFNGSDTAASSVKKSIFL